jgi:hypothetical protein
MAVEQQFEIIFQGQVADVAGYRFKNGRVFRIQFGQPTLKPLVITVAHDSEDKKFWTSMPEGRQELAEEIGKLVAAFIRNQSKICVTTTDKKLPAPSLFD